VPYLIIAATADSTALRFASR